ncbi:MAG: hypothetical protein QF412_14135 [Planctomycetota bacterium]|jgi:homoserine kinase|nr:hypothetical protein [Planctomycetota bacterium]
MSEPISFLVPATCAHLGPGFGVLAAAMNLSIEVTAMPTAGEEREVDRLGNVETSLLDDSHDEILRALNTAATKFDIDLPEGLLITTNSKIPPACGLGSVTADFAAGIGVAMRYASEKPSSDELVNLIIELGACPAHSGAALLGGLTTVTEASEPSAKQRRYRTHRWPIHDGWRFVLACPDVHIPASDSQRALPTSLPHAITRRTVGRALGLMYALAHGDEEELRDSFWDESHVPFRHHLVDGMREAMAAGREAGAAGTTICGYGPTIVGLTTDADKATSIADAMAAAFATKDQGATTMVLEPSEHGAVPTD